MEAPTQPCEATWSQPHFSGREIEAPKYPGSPLWQSQDLNPSLLGNDLSDPGRGARLPRMAGWRGSAWAHREVVHSLSLTCQTGARAAHASPLPQGDPQPFL